MGFARLRLQFSGINDVTPNPSFQRTASGGR
jgi:hypothetical protein